MADIKNTKTNLISRMITNVIKNELYVSRSMEYVIIQFTLEE